MPGSDSYASPMAMKEVVKESSRYGWDSFDAPRTWVLETDRDFSIEMLDRNTMEDRKRDQPEWASAFPNDTTYRNKVRLQYRGAPFDQKDVFQLDEFRATVVIPAHKRDPSEDEPDRYLTPYEAHLSHIMSGDHFEGYLSGLDLDIKEK